MRYGFLFLMVSCVQAADVVAVRAVNPPEYHIADGMVQAVRQSVIAAQVSGILLEIPVRAGDQVKRGQLLARIDNAAARQNAAATQAQISAARAQLDLAQKELARQQQLFAQSFISAAALDQAQTRHRASQSALGAILAQTDAARTQTGFYTHAAPFHGVIAEVSAEEGDMAMPGKALLTLYDPAALRVRVSVPQTELKRLHVGAIIRIELPAATYHATHFTVLPAADPDSLSVPVRIDLPAGASALPGMFAHVALPLANPARAQLRVPRSAVLRRAELTAVYVQDKDGRPLLRQIRLGKPEGDEVEVLAGLRAGEQVLRDPAQAR